ncbi:MAG: type II toxin-antitoxin system PemK/MazF family toxin [Leptolyngbyaceae cyanobacterium CSU_1_3]|nr:type II toxin-antitoxin system PemK/MazF family toxin [Leptolyngbyaceae cyanobacterium CSU_1_3]
MNRGDVYRVAKPPGNDPKQFRYFVVVSRDALITSKFSTVICAPIYTTHDGLSTQVAVGIAEGLKHDSSIHCDALMSLPKSMLTNYVGHLSPSKRQELKQALLAALAIEADEE